MFTVSAMLTTNVTIPATTWTTAYIDPASVSDDDREAYLAQYPEGSGKYVWRVPKAGYYCFDIVQILTNAPGSISATQWYYTMSDSDIDRVAGAVNLNRYDNTFYSATTVPLIRQLNAGQKIFQQVYFSQANKIRTLTATESLGDYDRTYMMYLGNDAGNY